MTAEPGAGPDPGEPGPQALRVAVAAGAHAVRVAAALAGGGPRLVAERPGGYDPGLAVGEVAGTGPVDVLALHAPGPPARLPTGWRAVAAPVALAAGRTCTVLDVGRTAAEATRVCDGRVVTHRRAPIGGDDLDRAVGTLLGPGAGADDARRVREELSLLPQTAWSGRTVTAAQVDAALDPVLDAIVALLPGVLDDGPLLLVGGVARCPRLAERVDAAGLVAPALVEVPPCPERAAVLAALAGWASPPAPGSDPGAEPAPALPAPPRRAVRRRARAAAVALLAGGVAMSVTEAVTPASGAGHPAAVSSDLAARGVLVQYGYRFAVPAGWEHTGGWPERRRSLLTRVGRPDGTDLIAVERTPLGYDSGAEPARARAELRAVYDRALAGGDAVSDYRPVRFAGRDAIGYRQRAAGGADVDWYVLLDGDAQLSVGCRHTPAGAGAVGSACAAVVASVGVER